jgi:AraC-like DNA-binding protein
VPGNVRPRSTAPAQVCVTAAHGIVDQVRERGLDPDALLVTVGLDSSTLARIDNRIELWQFCDLFELAAERTGAGDFGLDFGARYQPERLGFIGYLAASAATLGDALAGFARYMPYHQQGTIIGLDPCFDDRVGFSYSIVDGRVQTCRQDAELSLAVMLNIVRSALGHDWCPDEVHFAHAQPPGGRRRHEAVFGARLWFDQGCNRLVFPKSTLATPMPKRDPVLHRLILDQFRRMAPPAPARDIVALVKHHIGRLLEEGRSDLESVAHACDMAPWTLKRRLHDAGTTHQQLLTEVRRNLAVRCLLERRLSVTETAFALGYSEVSAFSRAFRQWTGLSARDYISREVGADF